MGRSDPPPLEDIAVAVRDRTWLDLRVVDVGLVERACPLNITVWPDRDDVLLRQEYIVGEDEIARREVTVDAEDIMWCRPTILEADDVTPPVLPEAEGRPSVEHIAGEIIAVVTFAERITPERLKNSNDAYCRKLCIRLMWELTPLNQTSIPQFFGYTSGGMTNVALHDTAKTPEMVARVVELHQLMEARMGHRLPACDRSHPASRQRQLLAT